jgi:hypothetical protein
MDEQFTVTFETIRNLSQIGTPRSAKNRPKFNQMKRTVAKITPQ